jgi:DNA-binding beta-propeller fold protein YncE
MKMKNLNSWLLLLVAALVLGGCAAKPKQDVRILWPPPPADPKLEWVGVYSSELDLPRSGFQQSIDKLTGALGEKTFISPIDIVSTPAGKVYISDVHLRNVRVFDFSTGQVGELAAAGIFKTPMGMALDGAGNLYVADSGHGKIVVFSAAGKYLRSFGDLENIQNPVNVVVNEQLQRIYVADSRQSKIFIFDLQGNYLRSFGVRGAGEGQLHTPQGMVFDKENNLFVADFLNARIMVFRADGEPVRMFGERGDQVYNFENPRDLAFDSEGNLHIVDSRKGLLLTYSPDGQLLLATGGGAARHHPLNFSSPKGIFVDDQDRIYIADQINRRFSVFQYLSQEYLSQNPVTEADLQNLMEFIERQSK